MDSDKYEERFIKLMLQNANERLCDYNRELNYLKNKCEKTKKLIKAAKCNINELNERLEAINND